MISYKRKWIAAVIACIGLTAACQDFLDVEQTVQPTTTGIFEEDGDFEAVIGSIWRVWWGTAQSSRPTNGVQVYPGVALATIAEELTVNGTSTTGQAHSVAQEPRIPYNNDQDGGNWFMRKPFYDLYQCIATSTEALQFLANPENVIGDPSNPAIGDHTNRAKTWTKMMQGLCHVYAGLYYDQGYVLDESIPVLFEYDYANNFVPYTAITQHGVDLLEDAIDMATAALPDTIPCTANWLNGRCSTQAGQFDHVLTRPINPTTCEPATGARPALSATCPQHLVEFMHSMIARAYAYNARTPRQRSTVGVGLNMNYTDWNKVLEHANKGVRSDFWVQATADNAVDSYYKRYTENSSPFRIDNELVGPADSSGAFQSWAAAPLATRSSIVIRTRDRRIHGPDVFNGAGDTLLTGGHKTPGVLIRPVISTTACSAAQRTAQNASAANCFNPNQQFSSSQGTYMWSNYAGNRYGAGLASTDYWRTGRLVTTNAKEMEFLKAEAYIRLGQPALAVAIINAQGRVTNGKLPALTVNGPPQSTAEELRTCVPKRKDGTCGDLFDALRYEKRLELYGLEALIPWADARGWGLMVNGSICMLAIPNRETDAIGRADMNYTFGGNTPGSVGLGPAASGATCTDP
jgi:hypothetical protein